MLLLKASVFRFTLFMFYVLYGLLIVFLEVAYQAYVGMVENVVLPIADALWTTEFRIVRILCRLFLAPHSVLVFFSMTKRHAEKVRANERLRAAQAGAADANRVLFYKEGYCLPDIVSFVKAHFVLIFCGIDFKFTDGKRLHEQYLYGMLESRYSRPLKG